MTYLFWYFWVTGVILHLWLVYKLIKPEFNRDFKKTPKQPTNPYAPVEKTCAVCDNQFWVEQGSETYICSECDAKGYFGRVV